MPDFVFISPGVYTREIDETTRPADVAGDGPVIVGPRSKGPAMVPVMLSEIDDDIQYFGNPSKDSKISDFASYASRAYLRNASAPLTFIRLLGYEDTGVSTGYSLGSNANAGLYVIGASGSDAVAVIASSGAVTLEGTLTSSVDQIAVNIAGYGSFTCSLNRNDSRYITKVLSTDPSQFDTKKHFVFATFDYANKVPAAQNAFFVYQMPVSADFTQGFITGSTTAVISQPFDSVEYDLFGFGSIFAGDSANTEVKVSIKDIKKSANESIYEYGTFTVVVRRFGDNDRNPQVVESFTNVNLDPDSPNYILRRIGDRFQVWNSVTKKFDVSGEYQNKSRYIYVVPSTDLLNGNVPRTALPFGFKGYRKPSTGALGDKATWPSVPYVQNLLYKSNFSTKVYWGAEVIDNASGSLKHGIVSRLKHFPNALIAASGTVDTKFSLRFLTASVQNVTGYAVGTRLSTAQVSQLSTSITYGASDGNLTLANIENTDLAKFTFPINDGYDGLDATKRDPFNPEDMLTATQYQVDSYRKALDMLSNPDEINMTELALPGIDKSLVTDYALEMVEDRSDCFYLMDVSGSSVDDVISDVSTKQLDSNYAAVYYPWVRLFDEVNNKFVLVPPTTIMPAVFAYNDRVGFSWFAPAGFSRGSLSRYGVTEAKEKLNAGDREKLYENRINPIATFSRQGLVVWGQKTLQLLPSALDRINVRRMLLTVRKFIAREGAQLVFEQNVASTWQRFENAVNPYLRQVKENAGIEDFRVILDERTTTEDLIERNIMFGKILIKPSRTAEVVLLDFHVTNNVSVFAE